MSDDFGKPLFPQLRYCMRCGMPETAEGMVFDEMGICRGCASQEMKMHIDWRERELAFRQIVDEAKSKAGDNYDCIIPISGGKDSVWQVHVLTKVYGMKPLAVTFARRWESEVGRFNLANALEKLDIDHVQFTPSPSLVRRAARRSLKCIGDSCWHCHRGVDAFPLQMAIAYKVPLLVWGESAAEGWSGRATHKDPPKFDLDYVDKISTRAKVDDMVGEGLTRRDLRPFVPPPRNDLEEMGVKRIFLSDYFFWDAERCVEFIKREYGWREAPVEGTYKQYKSVECTMTGPHDYSKFVKRGYGRAMDFGSQDARAGLMTREEALEISKRIDQVRPDGLDRYLEVAGYTEDEFFEILLSQRKEKAKELPDPRDLPGYKDVVAKKLEKARSK